MRRLLLAALACVLALAAAPPLRVVHACGQYSCPPVLAGVAPLQVVPDGKPVHLTLRGQNLAGVTTVIVSPLVGPQGWSTPDDQTLLLILPATIAPGIYSVRVLTPGGASDPSLALQFQVFPPSPPTPTSLPAGSPRKPAPTPTATPAPTATPIPPMPDTGVLGVVLPTAAHTTPLPTAGVIAAGSGQAPTSAAPSTVIGGLILGALLSLLWGDRRRLDGSWRTQPLRHLVGRPVQALGIGHICLYCGRLHYIGSTPRELWRAGRFCQERCSRNASGAPPERMGVRRGRG